MSTTSLTAYQRDVWTAGSQHEDSPQFNCVLHERVEGELDRATLVTAVEQVLQRHDTFRLRFDEHDGTPCQWSVSEGPKLRVLDLSGESDPAASCAAWRERTLQRPLPLRRSPMVEVSLLLESPSVTHLHLKAHHIVADGWTLNQLSHQIFADYARIRRGEESSGDSSSYLEFAQEERAYRASAECTRDREFHRSRLADVTPALFAHRAVDGSAQRARHSFLLEGPLIAQIRAAGLSPFAYIAAMLGTCLSRIHRAEEVTIGVPFLNRPEEHHQDVLGHFANTLPLRIRTEGGQSVRDLVADVRQATSAIRRHERTALGDVLRDIPGLPAGTRQLSDVTFSYMRYPRASRLPGITRALTLQAPSHDQDALAVYAIAFDDVDHVQVDLDYACDVFDADLPVEAVARHLKVLLTEGVGRLDEPVSAVPMLTPAERRDLLAEHSRGPVVPFADEATLSSLFEAQAARHPDRVAVVAAGSGASLTYGELDARANQVARALRADGVRPGDRVALLMERGPQLLVALFGILKSGGAYVPVDPGYPADRIRFLLEDSGARIVLADDVDRAPDVAGTAVRRPADLLHGPAGPLEPVATSRDLAYVIYTSGSTGRPKGVMVEHRSVVNRLAWMQRQHPLGEGDMLLQKTPVSFDVSVWELFWWAVEGAGLVLLPPGGEKDPEQMLRAVRDHRVSALHFVPSMLGPFLDLLQESPERAEEAARSLRFVFCSGEALATAQVDRFNRVFTQGRSPRPALVNLYGPTEATVDVSYHSCPTDPDRPVGRVPIGRPIDNIQLYVLGPDDHLQPSGVPGELCIGGVGVARGYLDRPDLTREKFVDDPFTPGGRLYRTGDLVRLLADGELEYLGRLDGQVKIRGNRVELGEVTNALLTAPGVHEALVVDRATAAAGTQLVGYYTAGSDLPVAGLRTHLARSLPPFMIPSHFLRIGRIPLTPNGKADRRALPAPGTSGGAAGHQEPRTPVETVLAEVWAEVLGVERVGVHDDYYALGGDSILMLRIRALAERRGVTFALGDLVRSPTVAGLGASADTAEPAPEPGLAPFALVSGVDRARLGDAEDAYPLTRLQLGLIYHSRRQESSAVYKDVFRYTLRMAWDEAAFRRAFDRLVARHPVLRAHFDLTGEPLQIVRPTVRGGLEVADLRAYGAAEAESRIEEHIRHRRFHDYAFERAPLYLFRAHVRPSAVDLVLSFHHALLDGGSVANLLGELLEDYAHGLGLPTGPVPDTPLPSAAHHVLAERRALEHEESRQYWRAKLDGRTPVQIDAFRPHQPADGGEETIVRLVELPAETGTRLRALAQERALSVKSVLFAAHGLTLGTLTGTAEVTTGLVSHGRPERAGAERIAGLFLNTLPIRISTAAESRLDIAREALRQERESHPYRHYPLSAVQEDLGGGTVIETAFNYVHFQQLAPVLGLDGIELTGFRTWEETNFTLLVNAVTDPVDHRVRLRIDCDGRTFTPEQADLYADLYVRTLQRLVDRPDEAPDQSFLAEEPRPAPAPLDDPRDTVVTLFDRQTARTPGATALVMGGERWSYAQLSAAAAAVAGKLRALGAPHGARTGIAMDRSPGTIAAILGALRAGTTVVPLDTGYPEKRLRSMIEQAGPFRVIAHARYAGLIGDPALLLPAESVTEPGPGADEAEPPVIDPEDPAYLLFTSGSTGEPKGVSMPHRALANLVAWQARTASGAVGGGTLQYAPLSFDVSFQEIFSTLCSGGTLHLVPDDVRRDMPALLRFLDEQGVERVFMPYVALQQLAEAADGLGLVPSRLRVLISSGEQLRVTEEIRRLCRRLPGVVLENQYGPTETHVATRFTMTGDPSAFPALPPIGTPIDGVEAYVLDARLRPVPPGVRGEVYLGGSCLAQGYAGRPDLTKERFLDHPFGRPALVYRTGDLGMVLPGGDIVCVGRADTQVKVRGFRVEPAEVELAVTAFADGCPGLREAAVVARRRGADDAFLSAFLVGDPASVDLGDLARHLRSVLPEYMVPSHFQWLERLPLTPSGKRDDAALGRIPLTGTAGSGTTTAPRDEHERVIAEMLGDLLQVTGLGVHDNFFDLGGTSLTAMRLVVSVEQRYGVGIPLGRLIAAPTVAELAAEVRSAVSGGAPAPFDPLVAIRPQGDRPPLFMVHPMGGNVLCYLPFAQYLPDDQPLYALQAAGADPGTEPLRSMEEIAASYVSALRRIQPHGPYTISGWSFGGFAAFEIARQLREAGEEVSRLILLDTTAVDTEQRNQYTEDALLGWFFWELLWLERGGASPVEEIPDDITSLDGRFAYIARRATEAGVLPAGSSGAVIGRLFRVYEANWNATLAYRPEPSAHELTLIRATEPLPEVLAAMHGAAGSRHRDPANGWGALAGGGLDVIGVPGDHLTIMEEPHVGHVSRTVARIIRTAPADASKEN
ncbi:amino acid adenylation domain-containing protein [Streptomyces sp. bgisy100]|uniref:amino acid adenylation domain-containing protein n=1 Tax=Streptomyces sp. bgisy100 TaxID=3413783 RepID=UPI003D73FA5D